MGRSLQSKTEELVYEEINDISDELGIECNIYPEVYYVHKNFPFERLGLPEREREDFYDLKKLGNGMYLIDSKIILLSSHDTYEIYGESGHFIHLNHSNINYRNKTNIDALFTETLVETVGYFCSKLGDSSRKLGFSKYPDYFENNEEFLKEIKSKDLDPSYIFVYQQGYGLGNKLFDSYLAGLTSKEKIVELMSKKLHGRYEPIYEFIKLKCLFDDSFLVKDNLEKLSQLK